MAKALFGHVAISSDPRFAAELRALRLRVRELESELERVRAESTMSTISVTDSDLMALEKEPVLT